MSTDASNRLNAFGALFGTAVLLCSTAASGQEHYEAQATESTKISRSSEHKTETKTFEVPVEVKMEYKSLDCTAKLDLEYFQRGDKAEVRSSITNPDCAASFGSYTVQLRYRGDDMELKTVNHDETWERTDMLPVTATRQYLIGDDVDLVRVKSRSLKCTCIAQDEQAENQ